MTRAISNSDPYFPIHPKKDHSNGIANLSCKNFIQFSGFTKIESSSFNHVKVSGQTTFFQSTANKIASSGYLHLLNCPKIGTVITSGHTRLDHCREVEEIKASGTFSLKNSKVSGNIELSGKETEIAHSTVSGTLECRERVVKICNSTIGKIVMKPVEVSYPSSSRQNPIITPREQIVELSGQNCRVGSVTFEKGVIGKVVLKDGATLSPEAISQE